MKTESRTDKQQLLSGNPNDFWSYVIAEPTTIKGSLRYSRQSHDERDTRGTRSSNGASLDNRASTGTNPYNAVTTSNQLSCRVDELFNHFQPYLQVWFLKNKLTELKISLSAAAESELKSIRMFESHGLSRAQDLLDKLIKETEGVTVRLDSIFTKAYEVFRIKAAAEISAAISLPRLEKIQEMREQYETSFRHEQHRLATEAVQNIRSVYEQSAPANWQVLRNSTGRQRQSANLSSGSLARAVTNSDVIIQELKSKAAMLGPKLRIERNNHNYLCGILQSLAAAGQVQLNFKKSISSSPTDALVTSYVESSIDNILQKKFQDGLSDDPTTKKQNSRITEASGDRFFAQADIWTRRSQYQPLAEALADLAQGLRTWNGLALAEEARPKNPAESSKMNHEATLVLSEIMILNTLNQESKAASEGLEAICAAVLHKLSSSNTRMPLHTNALAPDRNVLAAWVRSYTQESLLKLEVNEISRTLYLIESMQREICQLIPMEIIRSLSEPSHDNANASSIQPLMEKNCLFARYVMEQRFLRRHS
jgi:hypothetical protein